MSCFFSTVWALWFHFADWTHCFPPGTVDPQGSATSFCQCPAFSSPLQWELLSPPACHPALNTATLCQCLWCSACLPLPWTSGRRWCWGGCFSTWWGWEVLRGWSWPSLCHSPSPEVSTHVCQNACVPEHLWGRLLSGLEPFFLFGVYICSPPPHLWVWCGGSCGEVRTSSPASLPMLSPLSTRRALFARLFLAVFCPSCWLLLSQFPAAIMMEKLPWVRGGDWTQYCYQSKKILKRYLKI